MADEDRQDKAGSDLSRRRMLAIASAGVGSGLVKVPAEARPPMEGRTRNVRDFGAKGDGVTDDTEAFNRAAQADAEWSWDLLSSIIVPAGRYRIAGTVYLRKGQSLIGEGLSTYIDAADVKHSTFIMGRRRDKGRGVEDPGGLPVRIERLMGLGGTANEGFIYAAIPGFQISGLFLTAVGIGIEIEAADGIVSDVEIDQCLNGIVIRKSQNIVLSNLNVYAANYGISLEGRCWDIAIVNAVFCYTKYVALLLGDGAEEIRSVSVANCIFTNNVPYKTFQGYIHCRANRSDLLVTGCIFRNAPGYAINQGAGVDLSLSLHGCVIDGMRSNPDYNQSLASKGIKTGHGRFSLINCSFRHLASEAIRVGPGLVALQVEGGAVEEVKGDVIVVENDSVGPITIRNVHGLAQVATAGTEHRVTLPWLGSRCRWHVTVNSRDAEAPTPAAQYMVAAGQKAAVETLWSMGASAAAIVAPVMVSATDRAAAGRVVQIRLDARQVGTVAPAIDAVGYA
ncbi:glycosyl hydrolase family 28-related protein [Sphingomonas sp. DT-204]|uniref:glycosyl hydrolase family 28-related protein n=1 Tax=Sphingomonas sp. DT-204 TaxID=3396166 RepID=UPI003F1A6782